MDKIVQKEMWVRKKLKEYQKAVIAFSGGVDSALLLKIASEEIPSGVIAVTAVSETFTQEELQGTKDLCKEFGVEHVIIQSDEMENQNFVSNPPERCYYCKHLRFSALKGIARSKGIQYVLDGSNMDDLSDYRPGNKATKELEVKKPLQEVGLSKAEIRELSLRKGLSTWDNPAVSCLASRIPYGQTITKEKLLAIKSGEDYLKELGFTPCRLRHLGDTARIEISKDKFIDLIAQVDRLTTNLKNLGFTYVSLDLIGFRSGSMNEAIRREYNGST
ncbi:ATP-dependent sacrificial sulfur transferase LarE [Desulforamulus aquiferis]|uniref:ATP-dependent sacrificial sulfur transferase LarE n=1 Tax=Desulforamulus aquiferis TaxID=1397668 RepID=A0AAW7ZEJ4_9FIRM|nr:ATP-dependent sacrificial sulfur transferase LarE [Desulforamulus aquiferis]MDO7788179.1 ATP-dependent sacrificial sulfur transferase LarE [Desulforamulus aquiferis]